MITSPAFAGMKFAVYGLARSGLATCAALLASGAEVVAWDDDEAKRNQILLGTGRETAGKAGGGGGSPPAAPPVEPPLHHASHGPPPRAGEALLSIANPLEIDLDGFNAIVVSPGVPIIRHPIRAKADRHRLTLIGDIELFALARPALPPHRVVGITGTNGKSTTTALVRHICETAGLPTLMGGNIGLPILGRDPLPEGGVYVLELSSFQIDLTYNLTCDVAVLLNVTPDHLDRYPDFDSYAVSKSRLFGMSRESGVAVIADEDPVTAMLAGELERAMPTVRVRSTEVSGQEGWPALQGPHNAQNAAAATAVGRALGIDPGTIDRALRTYPGLPHRMERVGEKRGVLFVNDSKATNPTSTAPALAAYPRIHWILGGRRKTDELDACMGAIGHVAAAYTIGEATELFADLLADRGTAVTRSGDLAAAVAQAAAAAQPGEVVLLSPACASFDQFTDFEARGDAFKRAVGELPE